MVMVSFYSGAVGMEPDPQGGSAKGGAVSVTGGRTVRAVSTVRVQSRHWEGVPVCFAGGWLLFHMPVSVVDRFGI